MKVPESHLLYKEIDGEKKLAVSYSQIDTFLTCPMKWYKTYVEGQRSVEKQEATSYGTVIHKTLEYFFKNGKLPKGKDLGEALNYFNYHEDIPWQSPENMLTAMKQAGELLAWIVDLFDKDNNGKFVMPDTDLNPCEKLIRYGSVVGVEEDFVLPYKLPKPVDINGVVHTHVYIIGSVDLHLAIKHKGEVHHYVIDWKSGNKIFDQKKLDTNLQHPIYSFYIYRKYGHVLPDMNIYFFTRTRQYQKVQVDQGRKDDAIRILNETLSKMYDFENNRIKSFKAYIENPDTHTYSRKKAILDNSLACNQEPCPSALCYYCDFGMYKKNDCLYSSNWDPSKKKKK